jgi:AcrR family transcriptional regulator
VLPESAPAAARFAAGGPDFASRLVAAEGGGPTREEIIRAALKLFAEFGYRGTSLRRLASAVGIEAGSLYNHFSSKAELLADMVLFGTRELLLGVGELVAAAPADPVERLRTAIRAHIVFYAIHKEQVQVLEREVMMLTGEYAKENQKVRSEYERLFREILDDGIAKGSFRPDYPDVVTKGILRLAWGTAAWFRSGGRYTAEEVAEVYADIMLRGIVMPHVYEERFATVVRTVAATP